MAAKNAVIHHHSKRSLAVWVEGSAETGEVGIYIVILDQRGLKLGFGNWTSLEAGDKLAIAVGGIVMEVSVTVFKIAFHEISHYHFLLDYSSTIPRIGLIVHVYFRNKTIF